MRCSRTCLHLVLFILEQIEAWTEEGFAQSGGEVLGHEEPRRWGERKERSVTRGKRGVERMKWREKWKKTQRNGKMGGKWHQWLISDSTGSD